MKNFIQRLFSGIGETKKFPKIAWGNRFEGIEYETENNSLYIDSTFLGGRKIFTDSIKNWKDEQSIGQVKKGDIFKHVVQFANENSKEKPTIVINIDYDKSFWENLCKESDDLIKEIQYESDIQKEDFQFNYFLDRVRKKGTLTFGDKTIKTETEFLNYWESRKNR